MHKQDDHEGPVISTVATAGGRAGRNVKRGYRDALITAGFWSAAVWLAMFLTPNHDRRVLTAAIFTVLAVSAAVLFRAVANFLHYRERSRA